MCKCRWARIKEPAGQIWPAGHSLPMSVLANQYFAVNGKIDTALVAVFLDNLNAAVQGFVSDFSIIFFDIVQFPLCRFKKYSLVIMVFVF